MHVTISLLHSSLALVHVPRSRLHQLFHPILKQILQPDPTFLNITCNEVELSIFAQESALADFEPIARKDRRKQHARSGSSSHSHRSDFDAIEVSHERWSVLQVDSHSDQIDNSGARVNEVSAPLAAAGISILYQSSYMSDFILVKKSRLQETMTLLADAGFVIYASGSDTPITPARPKDRSSVHDFRSPVVTPSSMTRARSVTDPTGTKLDSRSVWTLANSSQASRPKTASPTAGEVRLLTSNLACVGLSEHQGADLWGLKIVKLVAFPELILSRAAPHFPVPLNPMSPPIFNLPPVTRKPSTPLFDFSPPEPDPVPESISPISSTPASSSSEDDGYFSHSPTKAPSFLPPQLVSSRSQVDLRNTSIVALAYKQRSKHLIEPLSPPLRNTNQTKRISGMPFFSYTRTAEGSSLTADVYVLAGLFPPPERYMIQCSGELDAADRCTNINLSDTRNWLDENDEDDDSQATFLSCLQIDLQRFGLDKYGLVNRFSKVLEENNINHMYSSSFKTANLLVDKKHARRAQALLNNC